MESLKKRIGILEAELRAREEYLARIEPLIVPVQLIHSFLHEARHDILSMGVSLDNLFTRTDRQRDSRDARLEVTRAYERLRERHDDLSGLLIRKRQAYAPLAHCIKDTARAQRDHVRTEISQDAASANVPTQLRLVLHHLIQNAAESYATKDRGDIMVRASIESDHVLVSVVDHGIGIPETVLPHIWSLGYTTKDKLGMGLFVVKRIVESWCGTAAITSAPNKGTIATLRFPMHHDKHSLDR
jgi:signal transduction histidine kinase